MKYLGGSFFPLNRELESSKSALSKDRTDTTLSLASNFSSPLKNKTELATRSRRQQSILPVYNQTRCQHPSRFFLKMTALCCMYCYSKWTLSSSRGFVWHSFDDERFTLVEKITGKSYVRNSGGIIQVYLRAWPLWSWFCLSVVTGRCHDTPPPERHTVQRQMSFPNQDWRCPLCFRDDALFVG